ncbi:hypothetical protein [Flavobacterium soyae]|uniref:Heavy-metal resistance n=1 Tax=Flavobacterium soyae TaxID=2903098 RepID=A0ABZ2UIM4_9FLAO|nr:hypothetical protein [Flavobacterium soyae]MCD9573402.1 hypothetical protein [Flavobacterium soyae]
MKTRLIVLIIIILPLFISAQNSDPSKPELQHTMYPWMEPKLSKMESTKNLSKGKVQRAKNRIAREEQKLIKLGQEEWKIELDLKAQLENLKQLENSSEKSNDPDHQKNIEKAKIRIAKSQEKLNKAKIEVELSAKTLNDYEVALKDARLTKYGS